MNTRRDVNVIKAIAVLAVVIYHANPDWIKHGYLGVDVFFVISGFLITKIFLKKSNEWQDVTSFIVRRTKRLYPALLLLLIIIYVYGFIKLPPISLKIAGHYVIAALLFGVNIFEQIKGVEYFLLNANDNPLYHMWSLGVEFQFYIVIALFFRIQNKQGFSAVKRNFGILFLSSLMLAFLMTVSSSVRFYMLPYRLWEFLAGGLIALYRVKDHHYGTWVKSIGLALIALSFYWNEDFFDEFRLVICVSGVLLYLGYGLNFFESTIYNVINWIGVISYSLYLWHIPVHYVLVREFGSGAKEFYAIYFLSLSFISFVSYNIIESKFRYNIYSNFSKILIFGLLLALTIFGVLGSLNGGYPDRSVFFANLQQNNGFGLACNGNTAINRKCASVDNPSVAVIGNSYAMAFVKPLLENGVDLVQLTQDSCAIGYVDNVKSPIRKSCSEFYGEVVRQVRRKSFDLIILSSPFDKELSSDNYMGSFLKIISELDSSKIIVIGPTPRASFNVGDCLLKYRDVDERYCDFDLNSNHFTRIQKLRKLLGSYSSVEFIDISDFICPNEHCYMTDGVDRPIYVDDGHLSLVGARKVLAGLKHKNFE